MHPKVSLSELGNVRMMWYERENVLPQDENRQIRLGLNMEFARAIIAVLCAEVSEPLEGLSLLRISFRAQRALTADLCREESEPSRIICVENFLTRVHGVLGHVQVRLSKTKV